MTDSSSPGPRIRRSAGMMKSPCEAAAARLPAKKPVPPRPEATQPERTSASPYPRPKVLMGEVAAPRGIEIGKQREAFRAFMTARRLRPTEWARAAGVAPSEILGFLTAKTRSIAPESLEKLARVANVAPQDMFG